MVNGVRVRMPEDYDFNSWGNAINNVRKGFYLV